MILVGSHHLDGIGRLLLFVPDQEDELGTPLCITVDSQTLADRTVTVRDRDTSRQERVASGDLAAFIGEKLGK